MSDTISATGHIPFREVPYLPLKLSLERRGEAVYLSNGQALKAYPPHMLAPLKHWAAHAPERVWLAQRDPVEPLREGWQELTYADLLRAIDQGLREPLTHQSTPDPGVH